MGMVEVVIRLPKEVYENIQKIDRIIAGRRNGKTIEFALWNGVKNGTVLPKGHGRLIDADKFIDALFVYGQADDKFKLGELIKYTPSEIWKIEEMLAKTVIEADKEVENDA